MNHTGYTDNFHCFIDLNNIRVICAICVWQIKGGISPFFVIG